MPRIPTRGRAVVLCGCVSIITYIPKDGTERPGLPGAALLHETYARMAFGGVTDEVPAQ